MPHQEDDTTVTARYGEDMEGPVASYAHLGGIPELLTFVLPVAVYLIWRRIQWGREMRAQESESTEPGMNPASTQEGEMADTDCMHVPCTCSAGEGGYCSDDCRHDAQAGNHGCRCGHEGCEAEDEEFGTAQGRKVL